MIWDDRSLNNIFLDPGTFQQYALAPANYVTPIPDALSSEAAAPMLCAGVTTVRTFDVSFPV